MPGRIVLAESLVVVDAGALPREPSCAGEVRERPRGESSDERVVSCEGRPSLDGGKAPGPSLVLSKLGLLVSKDGRVSRLESSGPPFAEELEGRVGGEGGAPKKGRSVPLAVWGTGVDASSDSERCSSFPRGNVNLE